MPFGCAPGWAPRRPGYLRPPSTPTRALFVLSLRHDPRGREWFRSLVMVALCFAYAAWLWPAGGAVFSARRSKRRRIATTKRINISARGVEPLGDDPLQAHRAA